MSTLVVTSKELDWGMSGSSVRRRDLRSKVSRPRVPHHRTFSAIGALRPHPADAASAGLNRLEHRRRMRVIDSQYPHHDEPTNQRTDEPPSYLIPNSSLTPSPDSHASVSTTLFP